MRQQNYEFHENKNHWSLTRTNKMYYITLIMQDDVIKWKHFPRYWPFVRGIHRSSVNSPHKGQWHGALIFFFDLRLNKRLSKQSGGWWFETPSRPLWRHHNGIISTVYPMKYVKSISHKISHKITFLFCLVSRSSCNQLLVDTRGTFTQAL